jgi:hypothetical protein
MTIDDENPNDELTGAAAFAAIRDAITRTDGRQPSMLIMPDDSVRALGGDPRDWPELDGHPGVRVIQPDPPLCEECGDSGEVLDAPGDVLDGRTYMTPCPACCGATHADGRVCRLPKHHDASMNATPHDWDRS